MKPCALIGHHSFSVNGLPTLDVTPSIYTLPSAALPSTPDIPSLRETQSHHRIAIPPVHGRVVRRARCEWRRNDVFLGGAWGLWECDESHVPPTTPGAAMRGSSQPLEIIVEDVTAKVGQFKPQSLISEFTIQPRATTPAPTTPYLEPAKIPSRPISNPSEALSLLSRPID